MRTLFGQLRTQIERWRRSRQHLSPSLKWARRRRMVLTGLLGSVWSFCLLIVLAQVGLVDYIGRLPWFAGVLFGTAVSAGFTLVRLLARKLRVQLVTGRLVALPLIAAIALLGLGGSSASAQAPLPDCSVTVSGAGLSGPLAAAETTPDEPLVVDPSVVDTITIDWNLPPDVELAGRRWWIRAEVAGFGRDLVSGTGEDGVTRYDVMGIDSSIAPGTYEVVGEFEGVCLHQVGYVRVVGSPFGNPIGRLAVGGIVVSTMLLTAAAATSRFDVWSVSVPDGLGFEIVDRTTGKRARGPLARGQVYDLKVTAELPDPIAAYQAMPGPVEVTAGVLGADGAGPQLSSFDPRQGVTEARVPFEVPGGHGDELRLNADISVGGQILQSVQIVERGWDRASRTVQRGLGSVIYRTGDLTARRLCGIVPVDTTVMVHGDASGRAVEVWALAGTEGVRVSARQRVGVEELEDAAARYRRDLTVAIDEWNRQPATASARLDTLQALAASGAALRRTVLGDGRSGTPPGGSVLIAHDDGALGSMTFPWAGLYEGPAPTGARPTLCPEHATGRCSDHEDGVVCPTLFWGLRHELQWSDGGAPSPTDAGSRRGPRWLDRLLGRTSPGQTLVPSRLGNRVPIDMLSIVAPQLTGADRIDRTIEGRQVLLDRASDVDRVRNALRIGRDRLELIHVLASADSDAPMWAGGTSSIVRRAGVSLWLDQPLDGHELAALSGGEWQLERGPVVFLNACDTGVVGPADHHLLLDAWRRLGARAVIVTETPVSAEQAADAAHRILSRFFDGERLGLALLLARRDELRERSSLSMLAYTYHGPAGLKLSRPVRTMTLDGIELDARPPQLTPTGGG